MKRHIITVLIVLSLYSIAYADVDLTLGSIRMVIEDYRGSVSLYRQAKNEEFIPLFDSMSFTSDSASYVLFDKAVYKLDVDSGFIIESSFEENIVTMICILENKVNIIMTYTIFSSVEENPQDSVKVAIKFTNLSEVPRLIGVKSVFDTWLGEASETHFTTFLRDELTTEYYFTDMNQAQWIQSANDDVAVRFLLAGDQVTQAQTIAVANKNVFSNLNWTPLLYVGRKFDSLQSYNNSALSITWSPVMMAVGSSKEIQFYLSTAAGDDYPVDISFMRSNPVVTALFSDLTDNTDLDYFVDIYPELPNSEIRSFDDSANVIEIRRLLSVVRELEANSSAVNREEILQINAEIDLIFEKIGR